MLRKSEASFESCEACSGMSGVHAPQIFTAGANVPAVHLTRIRASATSGPRPACVQARERAKPRRPRRPRPRFCIPLARLREMGAIHFATLLPVTYSCGRNRRHRSGAMHGSPDLLGAERVDEEVEVRGDLVALPDERRGRGVAAGGGPERSAGAHLEVTDCQAVLDFPRLSGVENEIIEVATHRRATSNVSRGADRGRGSAERRTTAGSHTRARPDKRRAGEGRSITKRCVG